MVEENLRETFDVVSCERSKYEASLASQFARVVGAVQTTKRKFLMRFHYALLVYNQEDKYLQAINFDTVLKIESIGICESESLCTRILIA